MICFIGLTLIPEVPNPLGVVGVLSAFNFPVAVYGWYVVSQSPSSHSRCLLAERPIGTLLYPSPLVMRPSGSPLHPHRSAPSQSQRSLQIYWREMAFLVLSPDLLRAGRMLVRRLPAVGRLTWVSGSFDILQEGSDLNFIDSWKFRLPVARTLGRKLRMPFSPASGRFCSS